MRILRFLLFFLTLAWGYQVIAPPSYGASTYHGTVVDAETKGPIEGAVVVVIWYKKPLITMNGPTYLHKVTEALTDAEGKFTADASPGMNWNPFRRVLKDPKIYPIIVIFKPGYGAYPLAPERPISSMEEIKDAIRRGKDLREAILKGGAVVELPKLETKEELDKYTSPGHIGISGAVPFERIPNVMRLINFQRKRLGLDTYPDPFRDK